jgi:PAS domain S-box-containing protein
MGGNKELKILFAEDMEADFEIAVNELTSNGLVFSRHRVETKENFIKALNEFKPDIVISDYSMPQFDGMKALQITKDYNKSIPFIILTGTLNEEIAVDCMKAGATDYVIKEHIGKLPFAVKEAMRYRDIMLKKIEAEAALLESETRYRSMFEKNYAVMVLLDSEDYRIIDANPAASGYYGYSIDELKNMNISDLSIEEEKSLLYRYNPSINNNANHFYSQHILSNSIVRDVEIFLSPINYRGAQLSHCIIQDITDRNKAVEALQISLNEKKELIKEIYHRTKNNMQVIISMFSLQTVYSDEDKIEKILKDMENRIRAMALVHEKLYKSRNLSRLDLKEYLTELVYNIIAGYGITDKIKILNNMMNIDVLIDTAVPCGIVVNELVTNIAKYAFPDNRPGILSIDLGMDQNGYILLVVSDNGIGCEIDLNSGNNLSMGLQIVKNIVEYQLRGIIELRAEAGMKWIIRFKDNVYNERV